MYIYVIMFIKVKKLLLCKLKSSWVFVPLNILIQYPWGSMHPHNAGSLHHRWTQPDDPLIPLVSNYIIITLHTV